MPSVKRTLKRASSAKVATAGLSNSIEIRPRTLDPARNPASEEEDGRREDAPLGEIRQQDRDEERDREDEDDDHGREP